MKTVLVFGTFDNLHPGHKWFLKKASEMGDKLLAVVARDEFVHKWKGRRPVHNEKHRLQQVNSLDIVNTAVLADPETHSYNIILAKKPDIICLGHDQGELAEDLQKWLKNNNWNCNIAVLPPWKRNLYSSTKIRGNRAKPEKNT